MPCTCTIEGGKITTLCEIHLEAASVNYNNAIEAAAKRIMFSTNDPWLVNKIRELKVAVENKRCEACDD
jgi:hypothetical protein